MFYLLHGSDTEKTRRKAHELVEICLKKRPGAEVFRLDSSRFGQSSIDQLIGGQGLFEKKHIVFADGLLENKEAKDYIVNKAKAIEESENVFIFLERETAKEILKKIEKYASKVQSFELKEKENKKSEFNIFSLTDAFGRRDKKAAWIIYQKAKQAGLEDEQIHGTLFWIVKSMIVANVSANAGEAKLNPFVFGKAKSFAQNFSEHELKKFSGDLVSIYHDARRGFHEMNIALERFILNI